MSRTWPDQPQPPRVIGPRTAGLVVGFLVLLGMAIANVPYRYVECNLLAVGPVSDRPRWTSDESPPMAVMAGWPLRYSVQYLTFDSAVEEASTGLAGDPGQGWLQPRWRSTERLLFNGLLAVGIAIAVYGLIQFRDRRIKDSRHPARTRVRLDLAGSIVVASLPLLVLGYQWSVTVHDLRLADRIAQRGSSYLSCWLPESMQSRVPAGLAKTLVRLRFVNLDRPNDALVRETVQIPTLIGLKLGPGEFDHRHLTPLKARLHLSTMIVNGRDVSETMLRCIGDCRWLYQLDLSSTDLDARGWRHLHSLDQLNVVDVRNTPLRLSELGQPAWSNTVRRLLLPQPEPGRTDRLVIEDWPRLNELVVDDGNRQINAAPLELRLSRLPVLRRLRLHRVQKIAFFGEDLPQLTHFGDLADIGQTRDRWDFDESLPSSLWLSRLDLCRAPSLSDLRCFTRDLDSITLRDCRRLKRIELSADTIRRDGTIELKPASRKQCQAWIDGLGAGVGPPSVTLSGLSLDGVDLTPLGNNPGIRELNILRSSLRFDQIRGFVGSSNLQHLDLGRCPITAEELTWLLHTCPSLERISADLSALSFLDVVNNDRLVTLVGTPILGAQRVRLVDLPKLREALHFKTAPNEFLIRNTPQLQGLIIEEPWPAGAVIQDLPELRWLVVGGPLVGDEVLQSVLPCDQLNRLTIAYGSVSRNMLAEIGRFERLVTLELPGADIDHSVIDAWQPLTHLQHVCLDDTPVTEEMINWLASIETLRSLSINRVSLDAAAANRLKSLHQLCELRLRDSVVDIQGVCGLLYVGLLNSIDLSGHRVDDQLIDAIARCTAIRSVVFSRHFVSPDHVRRLLQSNEDLRIAFTEESGERMPYDHLEMPPAIHAELLQREEKAIAVKRRARTHPRPMEHAMQVWSGNASATATDPSQGRIDLERFRHAPPATYPLAQESSGRGIIQP